MRCPQCGLVHAPQDVICRRCEIDMRTGEPTPRATRVAEAPAQSSFLLLKEKVKSKARVPWEKLRKPTAEPKTPLPLSSAVQTQEPTPSSPLPSAGNSEVVVVAAATKKSFSLAERITQWRNRPRLKELTCIQCGGVMFISRRQPYSRSGPITLLVLAGLLILGGIIFPLLFFPAGLALIAGIIYLRLGQTAWKCSACGFLVPRVKG